MGVPLQLPVYMYLPSAIFVGHTYFYQLDEFIGYTAVKLVKMSIFLDQSFLSFSVFLPLPTLFYLLFYLAHLLRELLLLIVETLTE